MVLIDFDNQKCKNVILHGGKFSGCCQMLLGSVLVPRNKMPVEATGKINACLN